MKFSYEMIAKACSTNDMLSERVGMTGVLKDLGIETSLGITLAQQRGLRCLFEYVREQTPPKRGTVLYREDPLTFTEKDIYSFFLRTWVDGFLESITLVIHQFLTDVAGALQDHVDRIDPTATRRSAEQRVMRAIWLLIRKEPIEIDKPFILRDVPILIQEKHMVDQLRAIWLDGAMAGVRVEKERTV
jgi:hypothetical protein